MIIGIYWTWKTYEAKANFNNSARIIVASTIAGLTTYLFLNAFSSSAWLMLAFGASLFVVVYTFLLPLIGAINQLDLNNLKIMFSGLGPFSKLLLTLLVLIKKIIRIKEKISGIRETK